jgi:PilZ domain
MALTQTMRFPPHERRHRRYRLQYPVHVSFDSGHLLSQLDTQSVNVSIGGMLLESDTAIPQDTSVTFLMTLQGGQITRPIQLAGEGRVVRVESIEAGQRFAIAVECKKPISEIDSYLSSA